MAELIIGDDTYIDPSMMDGTFARGYVPRDMAAFPMGAFAPPAQVKKIPRVEWPGIIRQQEADKSRLSDVWRRSGHKALQQNDPNRNGKWGYCWFYATTAAVMLLRAVMNQPPVRLSAFGGAFTIKNGRDEGAWGAQSLDFAANRGIPSEAVWPNFHVRNIPAADDAVWQDAAKYKVTEGFAELTAPVYDRDMSFDEEGSLLLQRIPVVKDEMWWGHCIVGTDLVDVSPNLSPEDPNRYGVRILNSWGESYGENGFAVLTGSKKISDNAVAPAIVLAT